MRRTAIFGAGGFGREIAFAVGDDNVAFFVVDAESEPIGRIVNDIPVLTTEEFLLQHSKYWMIIGVGDPDARRSIAKRLGEVMWAYSIIDESARVGMHNSVGHGTIICAGSIVTCNVRIGDHVHINLDCTIGHDAVIEDFVTLSPGVHISGNCHIEEGCFLGTGAVVFPGVRIGAWAKVGAGAVVTKDVRPGKTVVGIPAKEKTG